MVSTPSVSLLMGLVLLPLSSGCLRGTRSGDELLPSLHCARAPDVCWEDQVCDVPTGYCREARVDETLAYDVQLYDYTLALSTATRSFTGQVSLFLLATRPGTDTLVLDVGRTQDVPVEGRLVAHTPYTVTSVRDQAGTELAFTQDSTQGALTVRLAEPLPLQGAEVLTVRYHGPFNPITDPQHPLYFTGLMRREGRLGHPLVQTFGWPNHTRRWLPSHDHPRDTARAIARVSLDNDFQPLANGVRVPGETSGPPAFLLRQPVPPYALHVIASRFAEVPLGSVAGVPVTAYMYPVESERSLPLQWWMGTLEALRFLNEALGPYPFERFSMVQVPSALGGMEHATLVSISDARTELEASDDRGGALVIHELLHHWWGDNAHQATWEDFWLNESLASYYTAEALGALRGEAASQAELERARTRLLKTPSRYDDDALCGRHAQEQVPGEHSAASFAAPYAKGPWIWRMIRLQLGEPAFASFMKRFYAASRFRPYSTAGLLEQLNAEGRGDFTRFFEEWIHGRGWPRLASTWRYDAARRAVLLTVRQTQDVARHGTYTFSGPLALRYVFEDADAATPACEGAVTFEGGALESSVEIPCAAPPTRMEQPFTRDVLVELQP